MLDGDAKAWQGWASERGWHFLAPWTALTEKAADLRIKAMEAKVAEAVAQMHADPMRVYLAGQGDGAGLVFYVAARDPDVWAAAIAAGGSPKAAIDSNRLFAANTTLAPVLWIAPATKDNDALAKKLKDAGYNLEVRNSGTNEDAFNWLAQHRRDPFPSTADCETGTPLFARCYWITVTKFDPAERNDVLASTRVEPGSGAALDLGGFGYSPADAGPGILVVYLPEKYQGPLKMQDRILAIGGKPIQDARQYAAMMEETVEEKPVTVMVQRGKERIRLDTRIVLPRREETVTARVQGKYLPEEKEVQIVSRAIAGMRITVPEHWTPTVINWNGTEVAKADKPGCWELVENKEILSAAPCK